MILPAENTQRKPSYPALRSNLATILVISNLNASMYKELSGFAVL